MSCLKAVVLYYNYCMCFIYYISLLNWHVFFAAYYSVSLGISGCLYVCSSACLWTETIYSALHLLVLVLGLCCLLCPFVFSLTDYSLFSHPVSLPSLPFSSFAQAICTFPEHIKYREYSPVHGFTLVLNLATQ